jgi:hypothetical protein
MLTFRVNTFNNVFGFVIFSFVDVIFYIHFFYFQVSSNSNFFNSLLLLKMRKL